MKIDVARLQAKAESLKSMHRGPGMLVLANAWDAVSARIFEVEGFHAIATSSAGIASVLGYPDGQRMTLAENLEMVARIARAVRVPVTADVESGYDHTTDGATRVARATIEAGAVGLNLEDASFDPARTLLDMKLAADRVAALREEANRCGVPLVINARTDVFMLSNPDREARYAETVRRGNAYLEAGADCVFVPDMGDLNREMIARLVQGIQGPVSVLVGGKMPPLGELERLGVRRVSLGPRAMRAALGTLRDIARELKTTGTYERMNQGAYTYAEINRMLSNDSKEQ